MFKNININIKKRHSKLKTDQLVVPGAQPIGRKMPPENVYPKAELLIEGPGTFEQDLQIIKTKYLATEYKDRPCFLVLK